MKLFERITPALLLGLIFLSIACAPGSQSVKESSILGSWSTVKNYDATEITFSVERDGTRQFNSYFRGRPYESGTWQIKGEDLVILANGNNTYTFAAINVKKNKLTFTENGKQVIFSRIIKADPAREALTALIPALNKFLNVTFPPPAKTTFNWSGEAGNRSTQVNGYETTATVTVNGDFSHVNQAGTILFKDGFSADRYNATEIMNGYRKGNIVCLIILGSDPDNNNVCYFTIRAGSLVSGLTDNGKRIK